MTIVPFLNKINEVILNPALVLLFSIALLVFLYGGLQFILKASDEKGRDEAKKAMVWGLVGMFIMVTAFGIIRVILNSVGVSTNIYPLN